MDAETRQHVSDRAADIIWWIKGYRAAANDACDLCPFGEEHIDALRDLRIAWDAQTDKETVSDDDTITITDGAGNVRGRVPARRATAAAD